MRTLPSLTVIAVAVGLLGCSGPGSRPVGEMIPLPENGPAISGLLSAQEVNDAAKLYSAKCAKCHKFYDPRDYSAEEWDVWMKKMAKLSRLNSDQFSLLSHYLKTFQSRTPNEKKIPPIWQ